MMPVLIVFPLTTHSGGFFYGIIQQPKVEQFIYETMFAE